MTTIEQLKKYAGGSETELPGFVLGEPFIAMLRRPSLMVLAQNGTIPNPLIGVASDLFKDGITNSMKDDDSFKDMGQVLEIIARASLVSPTYEEITEAGLELSDNQLIYIYNYVQTGVDTLKVFREEQAAKQDTEPGRGTTKKSK